MEFLLEENILLRQTIRKIVQKIQNELIDDAAAGFDEGFDAAITMVLGIFEEESGVTIEEILQQKCN